MIFLISQYVIAHCDLCAYSGVIEISNKSQYLKNYIRAVTYVRAVKANLDLKKNLLNKHFFFNKL